MEFEDLQQIWDKQNNQTLYAINEDDLYKRIRNNSQSVNRTLNILEGAIIGSSIVSIGALSLNWAGDAKPFAMYLAPLILIIVSGYIFMLRQRRQQEAQQFEPTMMGELDKAIAQNDFLLARMQTMVWWYLWPVFGGFAVYFYFEQGPYWWPSILAMVVFGVASYAGIQWELNKFHLPKKHDLESLRDLLSQS